MRDLYTPEAFFGRVDGFYLDGEATPNAGRRRYLRSHPWRCLRRNARSALETLGVFVHLMLLVPDAELRREYRRRLWIAMKRRPRLTVLRAYCIKCALHYHYSRLATQMRQPRLRACASRRCLRPFWSRARAAFSVPQSRLR